MTREPDDDYYCYIPAWWLAAYRSGECTPNGQHWIRRGLSGYLYFARGFFDDLKRVFDRIGNVL